jgi:serine/threonine protein kinase
MGPGMTAPTHFGPYQVLSHLGAGGMGQVYLAHDPRLHRRVAIKVLPTEMTTDEPMRERLRREARAAAALDHPFICKGGRKPV